MIQEPKIPLYSWDGSAPVDETPALERLVGSCVAVQSRQVAFQVILESLGTTVDLLPVVMPITASIETFAGVLRAGAQPILLDIEPDTLQLCPARLQEVVEELSEGLVVLAHAPTGQSLSEALKATIGENVGIFDGGRILPPLGSGDLQLHFDVYGLDVVSSGAVIKHTYKDQIKILREVASGPVGLSAGIGAQAAKQAQQRLMALNNYDYKVFGVTRTLMDLLRKVEPAVTVFPPGWGMGLVLVSVPKAKLAVAHLASYGIEVSRAVVPLYEFPEVARRFGEQGVPDYPVACSLGNRVIALPTHPGVAGKESFIVEKLLEVV